jgi:lysophospholipase L1-like esterase
VRWVIFKCTVMFFVSSISAVIFTTSVHAWSSTDAPEYISSELKHHEFQPCPGRFSTISVSGEGSINACVMGDTVKVASYTPASGGAQCAISFPSESTFYRLDVCGAWGCVYSSLSDTLVTHDGVYTQLAHALSKTTYQNVIHYQPVRDTPNLTINKIDSISHQAMSLAISSNGKWVLYELKSVGIFLLNVETFDLRRVIAPGFNYGMGNDPRAELAVTNDGKTVAVVGMRLGLTVVAVNDTCGDKPSEYMQRYFTGAVTPCRYIYTPTDSYIQQFSYALKPKFSNDNTSFSFDAFSNIVQARHITLFENGKPNEEAVGYVALGDSFTSGEGETDNSYYIGGDTNKCHVSSRSYPYLLVSIWNIPTVSVACSGATIDSARSDSNNTNQTNQLRQLESHFAQVTTVGIGGNDAGMIGKLKDCLGIGTCSWAESAADRLATATEIRSLYPKLSDFYKQIKTRTTGPVIAISYPKVVTSEPECKSAIGILLDETERRFMNEAILLLNQVIFAASQQVGIEYVDVTDEFIGDQLCSSSTSAVMNAIRIGNDYPDIQALPMLKVIGAESFHPKPEGHVRIADKIAQAYPDYRNIEIVINSGTPTEVPELSPYWNSTEKRKVPLNSLSFIESSMLKAGDLFRLSFPAFSFKPLSNVVLQLHSEIKQLGNATVADDGSLIVDVVVNDFRPGQHSLRAIGQNYAGNEVEYYDFLQVAAAEADTLPSENVELPISAIASLPPSLHSRSSPGSNQKKTSSSSVQRINGPPNSNAPSTETVQKVASNVESSSSTPKQTVATSVPKQADRRIPNFLWAGLFILLFVALAAVLYVHYRKKHPWNASR